MNTWILTGFSLLDKADKAVGATFIKLRGLDGFLIIKNKNFSLDLDVVYLSLLSFLSLSLFFFPFPLPLPLL